MINLTYPINLDDPITFEDWLDKTDSNTNTYKTNLENLLTDETGLADLITEWFFDWYIGWNDPAKFWKYLKRNINTCLPQYNEMLRIQPGYAKYDWMVQKYEERKLDSTTDSNNTTQRGDDTKTVNKTDEKTGLIGLSGSNKNIRTGGETTEHTGTDSTAHNGTETDVHSGTDTVTLNGTDTNTKTGGHTETDIEGTHTDELTKVDGLHTQEYSPHVSKKTQNGGHTSSWGGNSHVEATLPMSKSYDYQQTAKKKEEGVAVEDTDDYFKSRAYQGMPSTSDTEPYDAYLDWKTVSAQSQNANRQYDVDKSNVTESYVYDKDSKGDITTNQGTKENPDMESRTKQGNKDNPDIKHFVYDDGGEKEEIGKNETTATLYNSQNTKGLDSTDATTYGSKDEVTYNSITDDATHSQTTNTSDNDTSKIDETDTHGDIKQTGATVASDKEITTGRDSDMANLLQNAKNFISRSNAWLWFRKQLIPCFESEML